MSEHFDVLIPLGAFVVIVLGLFLTYTGKFLSIREHTEYKLSVQRELDKMHERLNVLERTRPTTETLEAKLGAIKMPSIIIITFCSMYLSTVVAAQEQQEQQHLPAWATQAGIRGPTSNGFPLVDPSENVKALSEASSRRQDDLRAAFERSISQQLKNIEEINDLRFTLNKELREAARMTERVKIHPTEPMRR